MNTIKCFIGLSFFLILAPIARADEEPVLEGFVEEENSGEPLAGANVYIKEADRGVATDNEGYFELSGLDGGVYTVRFSFMGYESRVITDVLIRENRTERLEVALTPAAIEGEEVEVTESYFAHERTEQISGAGFNREEIRRSPGAGGELSRVAQTAAGVAGGGENSQDLMVRGGSPWENSHYIDNIPIPSVKHFKMQDGSSNGPIGLINTDLVTEMNFKTGAFPATYGNSLSSVMDINYREGSRTGIHGKAGFDMAGFSGSFEMPVDDGRGSILLSGRRSYLDLISDAFDSGIAPRYGDVQGKAVYDLSDNHQLTLLNIYGNNYVDNPRDEAEEMGMRTHLEVGGTQNTAGLNLSSRWSSELISNTSVSHSFTRDETTLYFTETGEKETDMEVQRNFVNFRNQNLCVLDDGHGLEFGIEGKWESGNYETWLAEDVLPSGFIREETLHENDISGLMASGFGSWTWDAGERLDITSGLRGYYTSLNGDFDFDPRLSATVGLTSNLNMNLGGSLHHQQIPYYYLAQKEEFESLSNVRTSHALAGLEYFLRKDTRITLEAYNKQYSNIPLQPEDAEEPHQGYTLDGMNRFEALESRGRGWARGIDLTLENKMADGFYGTVTASFFRSRYQDVNGDWRNRDFDVRTLFHVVGGYKPNDEWDFGIRWTYQGARPYTPIDEQASLEHRRTIRDMANFNKKRMPADHSLYLRADRRIFFENYTLTGYIEVWNAYNRQNVASYYWNTQEQKVDEQHQFEILPVGGFEVEL